MDETTIRIVIGAAATLGGAVIMVGGTLTLESFKQRFLRADQRKADGKELSAEEVRDRGALRDDLMQMITRSDARIDTLDKEKRELQQDCLALYTKVGHLEIEQEKTASRVSIILEKMELSIARATATIAAEFRPLVEELGPLVLEMRKALNLPIGEPEMRMRGIPISEDAGVDLIAKKMSAE